MSVLDRNVIDHIYVEENQIVLGISDHLPRNEDTIVAHWEILQDKLKDYVGYMYSGQLKEAYPNVNHTPCIKIFFSESFPAVVDKYLNKLKLYYNEHGYDLIWVFDPEVK